MKNVSDLLPVRGTFWDSKKRWNPVRVVNLFQGKNNTAPPEPDMIELGKYVYGELNLETHEKVASSIADNPDLMEIIEGIIVFKRLHLDSGFDAYEQFILKDKPRWTSDKIDFAYDSCVQMEQEINKRKEPSNFRAWKYLATAVAASLIFIFTWRHIPFSPSQESITSNGELVMQWVFQKPFKIIKDQSLSQRVMFSCEDK